jgi:hypothetical protein
MKTHALRPALCFGNIPCCCSSNRNISERRKMMFDLPLTAHAVLIAFFNLSSLLSKKAKKMQKSLVKARVF